MSTQKIPPWAGQHCQRSERAASLFLQTPSWPGVGHGVRLQQFLGGRFLSAISYPTVLVLRFQVCIFIQIGLSIYVSILHGGGVREIRMGSVFSGSFLMQTLLYSRWASINIYIYSNGRNIPKGKEREKKLASTCTLFSYAGRLSTQAPRQLFFIRDVGDKKNIVAKVS